MLMAALLSPDTTRLVAGVMRWGTWGANLDAPAVLHLIEHCLDLGIRTFDHADIYGSYSTEELFGTALAIRPTLRQKMSLVSKCGIKLPSPNRPTHEIKSYDTSKEHIIWSAENSLRMLRTDYLDLLLIHRPSPLMAPDEIAEGFTHLKKSGKVRFFGVSNFTPAQFELLHQRFPLVTNQVEASPLHLAPFLDGTFDQALRLKLPPMVWSPFGGGRLFASSNDPKIQSLQAVLKDLTKKYEKATADQLILAWLLKHPAQLFPVLGTAKESRIQDALKSLTINLEREDWFRIYEAALGQPIP